MSSEVIHNMKNMHAAVISPHHIRLGLTIEKRFPH